jgi:divalent metal cation (Fe/Co/Zn/Cd) transporter
MKEVKIKKWYQRLLNWKFIFTILIYNTFEEILEELIAYGLTKATGAILSVGLAIGATQGTELIIKKIWKSFSYKEGNDKMKILKKLGNYIANTLKFAWGNKLTATMIAIGAFAGYIAYHAAYFPYAWANIILAIVISLFAAFYSIRYGGETLKQILERWANKKLTKAQVKSAKEKTAEIHARALELQNINFQKLIAQATAEVEAKHANGNNN